MHNHLAETEDSLIEHLKKEVSQFLRIEYCSMPFWHEKHKKLLYLIHNDDPRDFINWDVIHETMFHSADQAEYEYLTKSKNWNTLKCLLKEDKIGNPAEYEYMPQSSGNLVHHLYSFMRLKDIAGFHLPGCKKVFEFGGGYGSFGRLLYRLGYVGYYYIFDLPIFSCLQKYFLSHLGIDICIKYNDTHNGNSNTHEKKILLINDMDYLMENVKAIFDDMDLFVGLWSISETSIDYRNYFLNDLVNPKYFLIGYQAKFAEIDNRRYFQQLIDKMSNYSWYNEQITHMKDQYYLIGLRKDI